MILVNASLSRDCLTQLTSLTTENTFPRNTEGKKTTSLQQADKCEKIPLVTIFILSNHRYFVNMISLAFLSVGCEMAFDWAVQNLHRAFDFIVLPVKRNRCRAFRRGYLQPRQIVKETIAHLFLKRGQS